MRWPALSSEALEWRSTRTGLSGRPPARTYVAALVPSIASLPVELPPGLDARAGEASREIARFDAELGGELAPFAAVLLRSESAASSKIERLTASARQIAMAELGAAKYGSNAPSIVANTRAMGAALALSRRPDQDAILAMHEALMAADDPEQAGRWRTEQVWIGGADHSPAGADFVPPHHERVPGAIADLVAFIARTDVAPLAHVAIAHAQFETIHPFTDGNGRTGRALVHAMMHGSGLTRNVTMPLSAGLLADVENYYGALDAYREGRPEVLVDQFVRASTRAVDNGRRLVQDVRTIRAEWDERIQVRRGSRTYDVADLLTRQPVVNAKTLAAQLGITASNVRRHMDALVEAGVVVETRVHRNGVMWSALQVLDALDDFAERAGKRRAGYGVAAPLREP
ncbi:Fic family protein [Sediminihabitans luteus]|uniref:Fic family protein n=1 Tax=Sediminihabitans luteus TaxID=1138585 RepID=A0A2M9CEU7_9CELL|nr:Fic family protein [Sediminihabitans luteus]PJJ70408.1 Fic family protein [Sediminihabitans luteus]